jgi:hypothetical protein
VQLHIKDRIYFPNILPKTGTFLEFNLKKSIVKKVAITDEDKEHFNIKTDQERGVINWDNEKDMAEPLEVSFTTEELEFLKKSCESLTEKENTDDFWMVVEKIYNSL